MPNKKTERRQLQAREAAQTSWSRTADRTARTEHGRRGLQAKVIRDLIAEIGEETWDAATPAQREQMAAVARSKHFARLARARHRKAAEGRFEEMRSKLSDAIAGRPSA